MIKLMEFGVEIYGLENNITNPLIKLNSCTNVSTLYEEAHKISLRVFNAEEKRIMKKIYDQLADHDISSLIYSINSLYATSDARLINR